MHGPRREDAASFAKVRLGKNPMFGSLANDTEKQKEWVVYDVTLIVGPHWQSLRQV